MTPHEFLSAKMQLASRYPFRETSGYRDHVSNVAVGGVQYSAHQVWLAADVVLGDGVNRREFIEFARRLGLLALDEGDHIHLQPLTWSKG